MIGIYMNVQNLRFRHKKEKRKKKKEKKETYFSGIVCM